MTKTTTTMVMATMSDECREVINYCKSHSKKGVIYEGTLLNSICWNMCKKMYSRRDMGFYTYVSLTDEEKKRCNGLYKEVVQFMKSRKTDKGYKEFIFNMDKLFVTIVAEVPEETHEEESAPVEAPVPVPVAPVFAGQTASEAASKDDVPWYD